MRDWYVYRHIRNDINLPFYIGIGNQANYKRAFSNKSRNKHWLNIVQKTSYTIEIIFEGLTKEDAVSKEVEFIKLYGRKCNNGLLCNQTDGGEGIISRENVEIWKKNLSKSAINMTQEHKEKISKSLKGHIGYMKGKKLTLEQREKISKKRKGIKLSEKTKEKLRQINLGKKLSEETKEKIKNTLSKIIITEEARKKMSKAASYKRSEETRRKMSEARKGKKMSEETKNKLREINLRKSKNLKS